jgi:hypothetical protein
MKGWQKVIIVTTLTLILVIPISKHAMSSDQHDNTSRYKVEYVSPERSKLKLSDEVLRESNQGDFLLATVKVAEEGYVPAGIEVRTRVSPLIFTANIPHEMLDGLERDPAVVSIEPAYKLRSY